MNNVHQTKQGKKVLIIGGGIAGLLAARVLSEYYDEVLVIERDDRPEKPGSRPGVPQSFHLHQVLPRGEAILERLFPGYVDGMLALGAFSMQNSMFQVIGRYGTVMFPGDEKGILYSRGLLEWFLYQQVQNIPHVRFLFQHDIIGLEISADRKRVTGISARQHEQREGHTTIQADLVVDTSGRYSKLPQWLAQAGYKIPENERVTSAIGYSTRYYKIPPQQKDHISVLVVESDPNSGNPLGGVLKTIEGDTWAVCLSSIGGNQYPPTDGPGFDAGFDKLFSPLIAAKLQGAEPLTEPRGYRIPECIRHHYERMEQWPEGLLVMGDAFCYFDPVYGQGMTIAAIEAETLAACLREQPGQPQPGFERRVLQRMQDAIYPAWWLSALDDLRWPGVIHSGPEPLQGVALLHKYFDLCIKKAARQFEMPPQAGEFNPMLMQYFMMNALFISPRDVVNLAMLEALLATETPEDKQAILADLFQGYDLEHQSIEAILDSIVPAFALAYDPQAVPAFGGN